jgi:hypothetical protein
MALHAAALHIRHAEVEGCRLLLDLRTGRYRILDHVASRMWKILTGEEAAATALPVLSEEYDVDMNRLEADLRDFARSCQEELLLTEETAKDGIGPPLPPEGAGGPRHRRPRASWPRAWRALAWTGWRLRGAEGLRLVYESCARLSIRPGDAGAGDLEPALAEFVRAENFYLARKAPDDCLARSLALYRFLCECGIDCQHTIGASRIPFRAHAWVEAQGKPLLDQRGLSMTPIARLAPVRAG